MKYVVVLSFVLPGLFPRAGPHGFLVGKPGLCRRWSVHDPNLVVDQCCGRSRSTNELVKSIPAGPSRCVPAVSTQYTITAQIGRVRDGHRDGQRHRTSRESHDIPGSRVVRVREGGAEAGREGAKSAHTANRREKR